MKTFTDLARTYPRLIAVGLNAEPVRSWLQAHARRDHLVLSNDVTGANVHPYRSLDQIRSNNAEIVLLSGVALHALFRYRYYSHARFVLVPAKLGMLRPKALFGLLRYLPRGKLKLAGIYEIAGVKWLAFKVGKPKGQSERVYVPADWGLGGFIQRLNADRRHYAMLRWWERLGNWPVDEDADFLASDVDSLAIRDMLDRQLGTVPVDLYSVSGGNASGGDSMAYYPPHIAERILERATEGPSGCRIPCPEDAFYSLAYHALYHKGLASGLPTETGLTPASHPAHDFKKILRAHAAALSIAPEHTATMETLDRLLAQHGWQPPRDMLSRYSHNNKWVKARFFGYAREALPPGLCVFVLREVAEQWQAVDLVQDKLAGIGFRLLGKHRIPDEQRTVVGRNLRGGNWSPGPWPASGGLPAYALVMADIAPQRVRGKQKKGYPNLDNARILYKSALRDMINASHPEAERANFIHASDSTGEALDYLTAIFPEEQKNELYERFLELRTAS